MIKFTGTVKVFHVKKGYGFITPDEEHWQALSAVGIIRDVYVHYSNIDPAKKHVFKKLTEHEKVEFQMGPGHGSDVRKQAKEVISKGVQAASSGTRIRQGNGRQVSHGVRTLAYENRGDQSRGFSTGKPFT